MESYNIKSKFEKDITFKGYADVLFHKSRIHYNEMTACLLSFWILYLHWWEVRLHSSTYLHKKYMSKQDLGRARFCMKYY